MVYCNLHWFIGLSDKQEVKKIKNTEKKLMNKKFLFYKNKRLVNPAPDLLWAAKEALLFATKN